MTETHEGFASPRATKTYVLCLPKDTIKVGLERRKEIMGKVEASKAARAALQKMVQTVMAEQVFANLAETNPEAKHLLAVMRGEATITPDETKVLQSMVAQQPEMKEPPLPKAVPARRMPRRPNVIDASVNYDDDEDE